MFRSLRHRPHRATSTDSSTATSSTDKRRTPSAFHFSVKKILGIRGRPALLAGSPRPSRLPMASPIAIDLPVRRVRPPEPVEVIASPCPSPCTPRSRELLMASATIGEARIDTDAHGSKEEVMGTAIVSETPSVCNHHLEPVVLSRSVSNLPATTQYCEGKGVHDTKMTNSPTIRPEKAIRGPLLYSPIRHPNGFTFDDAIECKHEVNPKGLSSSAAELASAKSVESAKRSLVVDGVQVERVVWLLLHEIIASIEQEASRQQSSLANERKKQGTQDRSSSASAVQVIADCSPPHVTSSMSDHSSSNPAHEVDNIIEATETHEMPSSHAEDPSRPVMNLGMDNAITRAMSSSHSEDDPSIAVTEVLCAEGETIHASISSPPTPDPTWTAGDADVISVAHTTPSTLCARLDESELAELSSGACNELLPEDVRKCAAPPRGVSEDVAHPQLSASNYDSPDLDDIEFSLPQLVVVSETYHECLGPAQGGVQDDVYWSSPQSHQFLDDSLPVGDGIYESVSAPVCVQEIPAQSCDDVENFAGDFGFESAAMPPATLSSDFLARNGRHRPKLKTIFAVGAVIWYPLLFGVVCWVAWNDDQAGISVSNNVRKMQSGNGTDHLPICGRVDANSSNVVLFKHEKARHQPSDIDIALSRRFLESFHSQTELREAEEAMWLVEVEYSRQHFAVDFVDASNPLEVEISRTIDETKEKSTNLIRDEPIHVNATRVPEMDQTVSGSPICKDEDDAQERSPPQKSASIQEMFPTLNAKAEEVVDLADIPMLPKWNHWFQWYLVAVATSLVLIAVLHLV